MSESEIMQSPYAVLFEAAKKGSEISTAEINALLESLDTNGEALDTFFKDLGVEDASNILWTATDDMYTELNKAADEAATLSNNTSDAYANAKKAAGAYRALAESAAMAAHIDS
jgi:myo-inositol-1-phosphate synthase